MIIEYNINEIASTSQHIIDYLNKNDKIKVISFDGEMGSGKTTLIKEICEILGVKSEVTSPTFAIINEYESQNNTLIYHFDFYRLKNLQEALDIGTEDYFYSGFYCFLEWPEIISAILPEKIINISIKIIDNNTRKLEITNI